MPDITDIPLWLLVPVVKLVAFTFPVNEALPPLRYPCTLTSLAVRFNCDLLSFINVTTLAFAVASPLLANNSATAPPNSLFATNPDVLPLFYVIAEILAVF